MGFVRPFTSTVRAVCASCNNDWMCALEAVAARALPPLILGQASVLESRDRPLIAAWVQKTALVSMHVSSKEDRAGGYGLPATEYRALFEARGSGQPLPETRAWIARYAGERIRASACVTPMVLQIEGTSAPQTPQGYLVTIILGKLLLQLLRFTASGLAIETFANDELSELWPDTSGATQLSDKKVDDKHVLKIERGAMIRSRISGILIEPWRPATELPESVLQGSMVKMPMPCGKHSSFYPAHLAAAGLRGTFHVFSTTCECGRGYLIVTERDGAHVKLEGAHEAIADAYERAQGDELSLKDENGIFWYKRLSGPWES